MRCLNCANELPPQQDFCPMCGHVTTRDVAKPHPVIVIALSLIVLALAALSAVYVLGARGFLGRTRFFSGARPYGVAVEHGNIATPDEFKPRGRLYFVPIGRQVISAQTLADYYQKKFNIQIRILPEMTLSVATYRPDRKQYVAESMVADLRQAYPQLARDPDAVLIGLTDEDLFQESTPNNKFTYSYHGGYRFGVVSTHRMDPGFWGHPPNSEIRDANTRQMLTKYVAFMYLHLPLSRDPTSVMRQPLTPGGGLDDLYESDLHSEESANGLDGNGWPCISHIYSYATHTLVPVSSLPTDCNLTPPPASPDEEVFRVELGPGRFVVHGMDLPAQSMPQMEYRRAYISGYRQQRALGWGSDVSFNTALTSDGADALTYIDVVREDGSRDHLERVSPGRGFSSTVVFEGRESMDSSYGARLTWDRDHFLINYRDGSSATYLACGDYQCFWTGYKDAAGRALRIERGPHRELLQVRSQDDQGIIFQSDDQHRIAQASDGSGNEVFYEYDSMGCLIRVRRRHGPETVYDYDSNHNMTRVSVVDAPSEAPHTLVTNEYDPAGHLISETIAGGSKYTIRYRKFDDGHASDLTVKDESAGKTAYFILTDEDYRVWTYPIRFPARRSTR